ncbi:MAG: hypothetical protein SFW35_00935 [Chitinophagales bacterium]|nr:hypothetical protein [Chitinophagales bacterium]
MHKFSDFLREHPFFGMASALLASMQAFMDTSTPYLQYLALLLGVAIGFVTLLVKLRELRQKNGQQ